MSILSTNPASYMGGTWVEWGSGCVPVGFNGNNANFNASEKTGGSESVTLTANQSGILSHAHTLSNHVHYIPALSGSTDVAGHHSHATAQSAPAIFNAGGSVNVAGGTGASFAEVWSIGTTGNGDHAHNVATNATWTGGNSDATSTASSNALEAHTNLQPYITCYMFKRTA